MDQGAQRWGGPGEDYRLGKIAGETTGSAAGPAQEPSTGAPRPGAGAPVWDVPRRRRSLPWFEIVFIGLGAAAVGAVVIGYVVAGGVATTVVMAMYALVPLFFVLALLSHVDRWEPEPVGPRLVVFLWGAGVAALVASVVNTAMLTNVAMVTGDYSGSMAVVAVFVAPFVEEFLKGLGVVLIVLWRRTSLNSPLDGIVYAGYAGAGFAFVENIQYFLQADQSGSVAFGAVVFMRGVLSPFVHPMATSFIGLALGWAVVRMRSRWAWVWMWPLGWLVAVGVHGLWNFLAGNAGLSWFVWYMVIEFPLFLVWVGALLLAARREARTIARGLEPYVRTGWLLPAEIPMVVDRSARRNARKWARGGGRNSARAMRTFQASAASLGLDQVLMTRTGAQPDRVHHDRELLDTLGDARKEFLTATRVASAQARLGA